MLLCIVDRSCGTQSLLTFRVQFNLKNDDECSRVKIHERVGSSTAPSVQRCTRALNANPTVMKKLRPTRFSACARTQRTPPRPCKVMRPSSAVRVTRRPHRAHSGHRFGSATEEALAIFAVRSRAIPRQWRFRSGAKKEAGGGRGSHGGPELPPL